MADRPIRVQLSRAKGWRMPPNTVRVSRVKGIGWGNPFRIGDPGTPDAASAVEAYRQYMAELLAGPAGTATIAAMDAKLRGKNLACWCKPGTPCHADVLLELANQEEGGNA